MAAGRRQASGGVVSRSSEGAAGCGCVLWGKFLPEAVLDDFGIEALGLFHEHSDEGAEGGMSAGAVVLERFGVLGDEGFDGGVDGGGVGGLEEAKLLGEGFDIDLGVGEVFKEFGGLGGGEFVLVDEFGDLCDAGGMDSEVVDGSGVFVGELGEDVDDEVGGAFWVGAGGDGLVEEVAGGAVGGERGGVSG